MMGMLYVLYCMIRQFVFTLQADLKKKIYKHTQSRQRRNDLQRFEIIQVMSPLSFSLEFISVSFFISITDYDFCLPFHVPTEFISVEFRAFSRIVVIFGVHWVQYIKSYRQPLLSIAILNTFINHVFFNITQITYIINI